MRRPHILKGNKATAYPTKVVAFDTETYSIETAPGEREQHLRLGVACYWRRRLEASGDTLDWLDFTSESEFWGWLCGRHTSRSKIVITSHNLSFDLAILHAFTQLPERGYTLTGYYCKGITTLATFKKKSRTLEFVDDTNFFAGTLESLSKLIDLPKLEVDFAAASDEALRIYCHRDVEIILELWRRWFAFLGEHRLGKWRRTLPSQAFGAFRHRFMHHRIAIHDHEPALKLERSAYHGGRAEVLRVGEYVGGPYYKLDVNSMYPYVMASYCYPTALYRYIEAPPLAYLEDKLKRYSVIARCDIEADDPAFALDVGGHKAYPTGRMTLTLCTNELRYVHDHGRILAIHALAYYRSAPIFVDYVQYFYRLKEQYHEQGNAAFRQITKGFLNYLYGKFGQRGLKDDVIGTCPLSEVKIVDCFDRETGKYFTLIFIAGQVIRRTQEDESYDSFPAIAAEVTANARLYLHHLITTAGREHVYYVDTDSLIVDGEGWYRLIPYIDESRLGALKVEGIATRIEIRAPKDYTFGDSQHTKGIRASAVEVGPDTFEQDKFPSLSGLLRQQQMDKYVIVKVRKKLRRRIYSGQVSPDGSVQPFVLPAVFPPQLEDGQLPL